jgi:uncharacterized protein
MTEKTLKYIELLELAGLTGVSIAKSFVEAGGFSLSGDVEPVRDWLTKKSDAGDPYAQHALAEFYARGIFGYIDLNLAYKWCMLAAEKDVGAAVFLLASLRERDLTDIKADQIEAASLRKRALGLLYGPAARSFGLEYLSGNVVPKNERLAYEYFQKGVSLGDAESMFQLALFISKSGGGDSHVRAKELLERAAEAGNASALRKLANLYLSGGEGVLQDVNKAREFQQRADVLERAYSYDIDPPSLR